MISEFVQYTININHRKRKFNFLFIAKRQRNYELGDSEI